MFWAMKTKPTALFSTAFMPTARATEWAFRGRMYCDTAYA